MADHVVIAPDGKDGVIKIKQEKGLKRSAEDDGGGEGSSTKLQKVEFPMEDRVTLIEKVKVLLPKRETHTYKSTISKLNWESVKFDSYTADTCKQEWEYIQSDIRKFRTATEVVNEALFLVQNPSYYHKISSLYPNMPKKPLTPFFQYYSEKNKSVKVKNPTFSQTKISQVLSVKYKTLPAKKKQKYVTRYATEMKEYEQQKIRFYEDHPELKLANMKRVERSKPPVCPTPYRLWLERRMRDYPDVRKSEIEGEMRKEWREVTEKKRLKWINLSLQKKDEYQKKLQEYCKIHPNFKVNSKPLLTKTERALLDKQNGKPSKPPMNGYSLFCSGFMKLRNGMTSTQRMQACSQEWKKLSDKNRMHYSSLATAAKKEYTENLTKYVSSLAEEEAALYEKELQMLNTIPKQKKKAKTKAEAETKPTPNNELDGFDLFISEHKKTYREKHRDLNKEDIDKMLTEKYEALPASKKKKYENKAKEMNELSSGSESSDDEEEAESEDEDPMPRDLWITHNLLSYMQVHKLTKQRARKSLQLAWENLEKSKKSPWKKQALQVKSRMTELLTKYPKKPHTSGYGIFTSEMMKNKDILYLDHKNKMKAVAARWKKASKVEKNKYEAKKERLWRKYNKDVENYKKSLSSQDSELLQHALDDPNMKAKKKTAGKKATKTTTKSKEESSSEEEETDSESEEEDDGSSSDDSDEEGQEEEDSAKKESESEDEDSAGKEDGSRANQSSDAESTSSSDSSSDEDSD